MDKRPELGDFLRSRRARLRPEDVGLTHYGGRRRVPGLRREELAQLAGVSVAYYTRLEQGQSQNASDAVLDAIARALGLDEDERAYLHGLARPAPAARRRPRPERVRPGVRMMIESFGDVPAMVIGRCTDALAWNPMAHTLLAGHLDFGAPDRPADRPNMARLLFLDPHTRELYADWRKKARDAVAYLRLAAGRYPDDPSLTALVGELAMKSPDFAALWSAHPVGDCAYNTREYRHPLVGALTLSEEVMPLPDDRGQRVMVWTAEPGSPSAAALRLLADLSAETADHPETAPVTR
ncbi:helix-turn-helix transcriptional regulator [Actinoallomurus soli]|uniref:helix-turn-helix transcriptional regulator n=1 Tax=Actinoallomurus soli TaxID=2952535 RepID=UPI0020924D62|nr:helix-turn-helix transcriptional regulator [Actinoallomurus soli]MCO5969476.1 helix-turn-helix transcriptional regulator [Actinoallomurus soli]